MNQDLRNVQLPEGYLARGYFDANGNIYRELITDHAEAVAKKLEGLTPSQFRRYFNHARRIEAQLRQEVDFDTIRHELDRMKPLVMSALADRNAKMTPTFAAMLHRMIDAVETSHDFVMGFMPHFEAVLAYFIYYNNRAHRGGQRR